LAGTLGVSALSLAERLLEARRNRAVPTFLKDAGDDVLLVRLNLSQMAGDGDNWIPLICEQHFGPLGERIDAMQAHWERSIQLAIPNIPECKLFDLLLSSREAVINGVKYGCGACPASPCSYEVAFRPADELLRVTVNDPGPGHEFDWSRHEQSAEELMLEAHRGLILMNRLPDRTQTEGRGSRVVMDFLLKPFAKPAVAA
jgi:anti-sigma regulatory factor (Ser/Thr protein kinase)